MSLGAADASGLERTVADSSIPVGNVGGAAAPVVGGVDGGASSADGGPVGSVHSAATPPSIPLVAGVAPSTFAEEIMKAKVASKPRVDPKPSQKKKRRRKTKLGKVSAREPEVPDEVVKPPLPPAKRKAAKRVEKPKRGDQDSSPKKLDPVVPKTGGPEKVVSACRKFAEGKCTFGEKCKFSHAPPAVVGSSNEPKKVDKPPAKTLGQYFKRRPAIVISKHDVHAAYAFRGFGARVAEYDTPTNLHAVAHAARENLFSYAVQTGCNKAKTSVRVCSIFGADRDHKMFADAPSGIRIDVTSYAAYRVEGDNSRAFSLRVPEVEGLFDVVILSDLYHGGPELGQPIDDVAIKTWMELSVDKSVFVILRQFVGEAGAEVYPSGADAKTFVREGAWVRTEDGIDFSSHLGAQRYPVHPDVAWLWQRSWKGIDISEVTQVGPLKLYKLTLTAPGAAKVKSCSIPDAQFVRRRVLEIETSNKKWWPPRWWVSLRNWWLGVRDVHEFPLHLQSYVGLTLSYKSRPAHGNAQDASLQALKVLLSKDQVAESLRERFPMWYNAMEQGTHQAILFAQKNMVVAEVLTDRMDTSVGEKDAALLRAPSVVPHYNPWKVLVFGFVGVAAAAVGIGFFLKWKWQDVPLISDSALVLLESGLVMERSSASRLRSLVSMKGDFVDAGGILAIKTGLIAAVDAVPFARKLVAVQSRGLYQIVQPVLEETFKFLFPWVAAACVAVEGATYVGMGFPGGAVGSLAMHGVCFAMHSFGPVGFVSACLLHALWNKFAVRKSDFLETIVFGTVGTVILSGVVGFLFWCWNPSSHRHYDHFVDLYDDLDHINEPIDCYEVLPAGISVDAVTSEVVRPPEMDGQMRVFIDGAPVELSEALQQVQLRDSSCPRMKLWPIVATNGMLWRPNNDEANLLVALCMRSHRVPDTAVFGVRRVLALNAWGFAAETLVKVWDLPPFQEFVDVIENSVANMGSRGKRLVDANKAVESGRMVYSLRKAATLKHNEKIGRKLDPEQRLSDSVRYFCGRIIISFDPASLARAVPTAHALADYMHTFLNGVPRELPGVGPVAVLYASGLKGPEIAAFVQSCAPDVHMVIVAGDDLVVRKAGLYVEGVLVEADARMCDQTLIHAIAAAIPRIFGMTNIQAEQLQLFNDMISCPYKARRGFLKVKGVTTPHMATGIPTTTTVTSLCVICAILHYLMGDKPLDVAGAELGMQFKVFRKDSLSQTTFLRSLFLEDNEGDLVLVNLPSMVLKCQLVRDPREIAGLDDSLGALHACAHAWASSWQHMGDDVPIVGAFLRMLRRIAKNGPKVEISAVHPDLQYKLLASGTPLRSKALEAYRFRYGLEEAQIVDCERLMDTVDRLPAYLEHLVFKTLHDVDYG